MKGIRQGGWFFLALFILALFGGCTVMAGNVSRAWTPAFLIWVVLVLPLKILNDRFQKMKWPMEFVTWAVVLLIALNLIWLGVSHT